MDFLNTLNYQIVSFVSHLPSELLYLIVGVLAYLECAALLGTVVPGETFVILAGLLASKNILNVNLLFPIVFAAAFFGDLTGYYAGQKFGMDLIEKLRRFLKIPQGYLDETQKFFGKYGAKTVIFARFVGFLRAFAPFMAGASKVKFIEFFLFDFFGALLWSAVLCYGSYYLGEGIYIVEKYLGRAALVTIFVIAAAFLGRSVIKNAFLKIEEIGKRFRLELLFSFWLLISAGLLYYLGVEAKEADVAFEMKILNFLVQHRSSALNLIASILTSLGSGYFIVFLTLAAFVLLVLRKRSFDAFLFLFGVATSNLLGGILKITLRTERPDVPLISLPQPGYSFPSGHVTAASLIFWTLGWIAYRELKGFLKWVSIFLFLIPFGVGFSRVYFGYHWPIDVLGGYALSFMVFSIWVYAYEKLREKEEAKS